MTREELWVLQPAYSGFAARPSFQRISIQTMHRNNTGRSLSVMHARAQTRSFMTLLTLCLTPPTLGDKARSGQSSSPRSPWLLRSIVLVVCWYVVLSEDGDSCHRRARRPTNTFISQQAVSRWPGSAAPSATVMHATTPAAFYWLRSKRLP